MTEGAQRLVRAPPFIDLFPIELRQPLDGSWEPISPRLQLLWSPPL